MTNSFNNKPLKWTNAGIEPTNDFIANGWSPGYKPPAEYFNFKFNNDYKVMTELQEKMISHTDNENNPHRITKSQIGLSNVDNTSDMDKPISLANQNALNNKADKIHVHTKNQISDFPTSLPANGGNADTVDGKHANNFATAEQGTKADNALPASNYTASDVLDKLKMVGGSGSGLDSDKLDGKHASEFVLTKNYTATKVLEKLKTIDGSNSGLDSDTLDGKHANDFPQGFYKNLPFTSANDSWFRIISSNIHAICGGIFTVQAYVENDVSVLVFAATKVYGSSNFKTELNILSKNHWNSGIIDKIRIVKTADNYEFIDVHIKYQAQNNPDNVGIIINFSGLGWKAVDSVTNVNNPGGDIVGEFISV